MPSKRILWSIGSKVKVYFLTHKQINFNAEDLLKSLEIESILT